LSLTAAAIGAALVLSSCASNDPPPPLEEESVASLERNPFGSDLATDGTPKPGGTLIMAGQGVSGFDPVKTSGGLGIYDQLLKVEPDGTISPYMAESMTSPDGGTTWVLKLRDGVNFSDGTPLDAEAVVFNVRRHMDSPTAAGHAASLPIVDLVATDPLTVTFTLSSPIGEFPARFADPFVAGSFVGALGVIGSPTAIQQYGEDYNRNPVGAGPFKLVSWTPGSQVVLAKNQDYWQKDKGLPYLDGFEYRQIPDTETRFASLQNGDVDMIGSLFHSELIGGIDNPDLNVYYRPGNGAEWLYFNHTEPPFDDRRMREAVAVGLNLDALSATQFRGRMEKADSYFGEDSPYYNAEAGASWPQYDLAKAKALVDEYVADGGSRAVRISNTTAPNRVKFAEFLQAQLTEIGMEPTVEFFDPTEFVDRVQKQNFQIVPYAPGQWLNPYPVVYDMFHTDGQANRGKYSNPEMDALLEKAISTTDDAERTELYRQVQQLATDDLAVVWYSRGYHSVITDKDVKGVVRNSGGATYPEYLWLDR
jgi:peptide/nickel transport system substrate-binding protein